MTRSCYACGATQSIDVSTGKPQWYRNRDTDLYLCRICYQWIIRREYLQEYAKRRVNFRDKIIFADHPLRVGVCNWCRGILGEINAQTNKLIKRTALHHEEYDENDPFKHTIELCDQCHGLHGALNQGLGFISKNKIGPKDQNSILSPKMNADKHIPRSERRCYSCGSNKTALIYKGKRADTLKIPREIWYLNKPTPFVLCHACNLRIIRREQRDRYNTFRIKYKNKSVYIGRPVRKGVCSKCGKSVAKGEIKTTSLHHTQYDDADPLAHTIELCHSCHSKKTIELEQVILLTRKKKKV